MIRRSPISTLFPYTPLFRSAFFIGYQVWPIVRVLWLSFTDSQFLTNKPEHWVWNCETVKLSHRTDRKSTHLNSSHTSISHAVFCLKKDNSISIRYSHPQSRQ